MANDSVEGFILQLGDEPRYILWPSMPFWITDEEIFNEARVFDTLPLGAKVSQHYFYATDKCIWFEGKPYGT